MPMESEFEAERKRTFLGMWDQDSGARCGTSFCKWGLAFLTGNRAGILWRVWHLSSNCADAIGGHQLGCQGWSGALVVEELLQWGLPGTVAFRGRTAWDEASPGGASLGTDFTRAGPTIFTWFSFLARYSRQSLANSMVCKVRSSFSWMVVCRCSSLLRVSCILSWSLCWLPGPGRC